MKPFVQLLLYLSLTLPVHSQSSKDLPLPAANLQTLANGSYVIPMGNALQADASGYFNLRSYGLVIHLLNNNVKIKWVIKAGKLKDGIDFSGTAEKILPTSSSAASCSFIAGPFIIDAADTTGVASLVQMFYTNHSLTGNNRPAVYKLTASVSNVDIRYDLTGFIPKVAILNDGGNASLHAGYLQKAAVPSGNFQVASASDLLSKCYTFASEPHADTVAISSSKVDAVKIFVRYGGNFLAQCEAVLSYENRSNGYFQTTTGIVKDNSPVAPSSLIYPNPDLSFSQIQGDFSISQGGSIRNWKLVPFGTYQNNAHNHSNNTTGSVPIGASVSKLNASDKAGGLVFYVGSHEFSSVTSYPSINGIRMYMNAVLTPVSLNLDCSIGSTRLYALSTQAEQFTVSKNQGYAQLNWTTYNSSPSTRFIIEVSNDGQTFQDAGSVSSGSGIAQLNGGTLYTFRDSFYSERRRVVYYRLRSEEADGKILYSHILFLRIDASESIEVKSYPNPVTSILHLNLPKEWIAKPITFEWMDISGKTISFSEKRVNNLLQQLNVSHIKTGYYLLVIRCNGEQVFKKILKN